MRNYNLNFLRTDTSDKRIINKALVNRRVISPYVFKWSKSVNTGCREILLGYIKDFNAETTPPVKSFRVFVTGPDNVETINIIRSHKNRKIFLYHLAQFLSNYSAKDATIRIASNSEYDIRVTNFTDFNGAAMSAALLMLRAPALLTNIMNSIVGDTKEDWMVGAVTGCILSSLNETVEYMKKYNFSYEYSEYYSEDMNQGAMPLTTLIIAGVLSLMSGKYNMVDGYNSGSGVSTAVLNSGKLKELILKNELFNSILSYILKDMSEDDVKLCKSYFKLHGQFLRPLFI
jgi:hypothetical protein